MQKPTIMLVDDEKAVINSLLNQLRRHFGYQYRYESATNTDEAWSLLMDRPERFALVISDWVIPGQRGDRFLELLQVECPKLDVILLSGFVNDETIEAVQKKTNIRAFVRKPWEEAELIEAVERIVRTPQST
jgi:CheY-like chemotaxis protein